jgi:hypothetical protein
MKPWLIILPTSIPIEEETDAIYLTAAEIRALYEVDLSSH